MDPDWGTQPSFQQIVSLKLLHFLPKPAPIHLFTFILYNRSGLPLNCLLSSSPIALAGVEDRAVFRLYRGLRRQCAGSRWPCALETRSGEPLCPFASASLLFLFPSSEMWVWIFLP